MGIFLRSIVMTLAVVIMFALTAEAAEDDWEEDLSAQIEFAHDCEVAFLSHVVEREVDGKQLVLAKVHCLDQRAFDAIRRNRLESFEFKECTDREKQTC